MEKQRRWFISQFKSMTINCVTSLVDKGRNVNQNAAVDLLLEQLQYLSSVMTLRE